MLINSNNAYLYSMDISSDKKSKYSAKKYYELLKHNKYSIAFGTSRSFRLSEDIVNDKYWKFIF